MNKDKETTIFENVRPKLMGIAYRFLSTVSDAEDVVQDVYIKWLNSNITTINNPEAWLKKVCTRKCLDIIKSVEKSRVSYVGTWLPEPIQHQYLASNTQSNESKLADSLTTAFLIVLDRLTARERAAYLLHDIFDTPYSEVADTLNISEPACRKLVSRAKQNLSIQQKRQSLSYEHSSKLLQSFKRAIINENPQELQTLLTSSVTVKADGGGKVAAIQQDITGINDVKDFLAKQLSIFWRGFTWLSTIINGNAGLIIKDGSEIHAIVSFEFTDKNTINEIFIVRNPCKINQIDHSPIN